MNSTIPFAMKKAQTPQVASCFTINHYVAAERPAFWSQLGSAARAESLMVRKVKCLNQGHFLILILKSFSTQDTAAHCVWDIRNIVIKPLFFKSRCSLPQICCCVKLTMWRGLKKELLRGAPPSSTVSLKDGFWVEGCSHLGIKLQCLNFFYFGVFFFF